MSCSSKFTVLKTNVLREKKTITGNTSFKNLVKYILPNLT